MARDHNYPTSKIQKLIEREEKCKKLVGSQMKDEEAIQNSSFFIKFSSAPCDHFVFVDRHFLFWQIFI
jgi:hypothetical protein